MNCSRSMQTMVHGTNSDCIRLSAAMLPIRSPAATESTQSPLMFSFFKKKPKEQDAAQQAEPQEVAQEFIVPAVTPAVARQSWLTRLKSGLSKTSSSLTTLFVGAKIDDDLYEELEAALLMADAGVEATRFLLEGLKRKVKEQK